MLQPKDRARFEFRLARAIAKRNASIRRRLSELLGDPPDIDALMSSDIWDIVASEYRGDLMPLLETVFTAGVEAVQMGVGVEAGVVVDEWAARWASEHAGKLAKGLNETTQKVIRKAVADYYDAPDLGILQGRLERLFSPVRAEMIAVTEVTNASAQGGREYAQWLNREHGVRTVEMWNTAEDERVCPICGPRDRMPQGSNWTDPPAAHPRCRCWTSYEVVDDAG